MHRSATFGLDCTLLAVLFVASPAYAAPRLPDMGRAAPLVLRDAVTGAPLRDEVRGKTILLSFIATTCREACPITEGVFSAVAASLRSEHLLGRKIVLVLATVDPVTDTVQRLRATARAIGAPTGGLVLATGTPANVRRILDAYGIAVRFHHGSRIDPDHDVATYLIDPRRHVRYEFSPSYPPSAIARIAGSLAKGTS